MDIRFRCVAGISLLWVATQVHAVDTGITAAARLEWKDNVRLEERNPVEDLLEVIDLGAYLNYSESWYDFKINYNVSHETYERDTFDAANYYNGDTSLNVLLLPERFNWNFSVTSATTLIQSTDSNTPDNRDQRNIYSTAPKFYIISHQGDKVAIQASATKVDFRESDQSDSDRTGVNTIWTHAFSSLSLFNLSFGAQKVNFEDVEDYESKTYQLGIVRTINGGNIQIGAGQTKIIPESSDSHDGTNYKLKLTWSNDIHIIDLSAFQDLTDSTVGLAADGFDFSQSITPSEVSTGDVDVVTRTRYSLNDRYSLSRTFAVTGNIYFDDEASETSDQETERKGGYFYISKMLVDKYFLNLDFNYEHSDEKVVDIVEVIRRYRIKLSRTLDENLSCAAWVGREESKSVSFGGSNYEEHTVGLSINGRF